MNDFKIDTLIEDPQWSADLPVLDDLAHRAIHAALAQIEQGGREPISFSEVSLAFVGNEKIKTLNRDFRKKDKPTNVLSFPGTEIDGRRPLLGDIVLAFETVRDEALAQGKSLQAHTTHLIIHGFLHLQGFDHQNDEEAHEMESLEIQALQGLGIANPYDKEVGL